MSPKTLLTADELEQMPDDDSVRTELDEGELITMPPAGEDHGNCETEIVSIPNRGHSLTIDSGWKEVAEVALAFVLEHAPAKSAVRSSTS